MSFIFYIYREYILTVVLANIRVGNQDLVNFNVNFQQILGINKYFKHNVLSTIICFLIYKIE